MRVSSSHQAEPREVLLSGVPVGGATNKARSSGFWKLQYSRKIMPEVDRIRRMIDRATERQRGILADFLLYRGGDVLNHHEIDYFLADYNTKGA